MLLELNDVGQRGCIHTELELQPYEENLVYVSIIFSLESL